MPLNTFSFSLESDNSQNKQVSQAGSSQQTSLQPNNPVGFFEQCQLLLENQKKMEEEYKKNDRYNYNQDEANTSYDDESMINDLRQLKIENAKELTYMVAGFIPQLIDNLYLQSDSLEKRHFELINCLSDIIIECQFIKTFGREDKYQYLAQYLYRCGLRYEQEQFKAMDTANFLKMGLLYEMSISVFKQSESLDDNNKRILAKCYYKKIYFAVCVNSELLWLHGYRQDMPLAAKNIYQQLSNPTKKDKLELIRCIFILLCITVGTDEESLALNYYNEAFSLFNTIEDFSDKNKVEVLFWIIKLISIMNENSCDFIELKKKLISNAIGIHRSINITSPSLSNYNSALFFQSSSIFNDFFDACIEHYEETKEEEVFFFLVNLSRSDLLDFFIDKHLVRMARNPLVPNEWKIKFYKQAIEESILNAEVHDTPIITRNSVLSKYRLELGNVLKDSNKIKWAIEEYSKVFSILNSFDNLSGKQHDAFCSCLQSLFECFNQLLIKDGTNFGELQAEINFIFFRPLNMQYLPHIHFYVALHAFINTLACRFFPFSSNSVFLQTIAHWLHPDCTKEDFMNEVRSLIFTSTTPCQALVYSIAIRVLELIKGDLNITLHTNLTDFSDDELQFLENSMKSLEQAIEKNTSLEARATFVSLSYMQQQLNELKQENARLNERIYQLESVSIVTGNEKAVDNTQEISQQAASSSGSMAPEIVDDSRKRKRTEDSDQRKITSFFNPVNKKRPGEEQKGFSSFSNSL